MIDDLNGAGASVEEEADDADRSFAVNDNYGTVIQAHQYIEYRSVEVERRLPCSSIPAMDLQVALDRYARPPHLDVARTLLEQTGALVLVAEPGSGARTTALHLLAGLRGVEIHELEPDGDPRGQVERLLAESAHAHLLELDAGVDAGWHRFCREVLGRTDELRVRGSFLVVTTSSSTWASPADAGTSVLRLGRPAARDVALAHLRGTDREPWLDVPAVASHLGDHTRPRDAARLAALLADAANPDSAVQEFEGWRDHLRAWFEGDEESAGHHDVAERALLVAAAVLNGFEPARVWNSAGLLMKRMQAAEERVIPLAGPGLGSRVEALGARLEGSAVRLDWRRRSLDRAVLDYVWNEYPPLQRELLSWLLTLSASGEIRERLAVMLSELVARQEDTTFLATIAREAGTAPRSLVADVLSRTGRDAQIGRAVRRRLYNWATGGTTPAGLGVAIADACGRDLGRRYPRNALTRLRHLARHPDTAVREAVVGALVRLAEEPGLRGQVLDEVADWWRSADARRRQTGGGAFVELASTVDSNGAPILLTVSADVVVAGWRHVLGTADANGEAVSRAVAVWLEAGETARMLLARAAAGDLVAITLFRSVHAWAGGVADGESRRSRVTAMDALYERILQEERR